MKDWGAQVETARGLVEEIVKEIDAGIEVIGNPNKGLESDTYEIFLVKEEKRRNLLVSFEEIINAQSDPTELKNKLKSTWETGPKK
jgi:hypothetical protein